MSLRHARSRWTPYRLSSLRVLLHAQFEAARRGLVPGRTVEDRFTTGSGALGGRTAETGQVWAVNSAGYTISSQRITVSAGDKTSLIDTGIVDSVYRCDHQSGGSTISGLSFRGIDLNNHLRVLNDATAGQVSIRKYDGGVETTLETVTVSVTGSASVRWRIEALGTSIKIYANGTQIVFSGAGGAYVLTGGDATKFAGASATRVGFRTQTRTTTQTWDNVRVDPPGTTALTDSITDDSGNGFGTAQATTSKQAIILHDGARWVFRQDGVDDIQAGSPNLSTATRGYALIALAQEPVLGAACSILSSADEASTTRYLTLGISAAAKIEYRQNNGGTSNNLSGDTTIVAGSPYLLEWASDDTAVSAWVNATAQTLTPTTGVNNGNWFGDVSARDNYTIGGLKNTSEALLCNADLCTIILTDAVPSSDDQARLRRWVNLQNALGISL